jgi:hypothetical protein
VYAWEWVSSLGWLGGCMGEGFATLQLGAPGQALPMSVMVY